MTTRIETDLMIPGRGQPIEAATGRTQVTLVIVDYRDNDLGTYNEFSIAVFARESRAARGVPVVSPWARMMRGQVATFICHACSSYRTLVASSQAAVACRRKHR